MLQFSLMMEMEIPKKGIVDTRENVGYGKRILRTYKGFGEPTPLSIFMGSKIHEYDQALIELFRSRGFEIVEGGKFNKDNPLEINISLDNEVSSYERDKNIAKLVGIDMPTSYTPEEILQNADPVVAKIPEANGGQSKYVLETREQKVKFITWALLYQNLPYLLYKERNPKAVIDRILKKVDQGDFNDPYIDKRGWLDRWVFEEYIDTGDFATSVRVVTDAFGNIYYSQIARSEDKTRTVPMPIPKLEDSVLIELIKPGNSLSIALTHPDSPLYIAPTEFVSNVMAGGSPILLDGIQMMDQEDRQILGNLHINPDNPFLPQSLKMISQNIGKQFREYSTHAGIDYLIRKDGSFVLLEINRGPVLRPQGLGLPKGTNQLECELVLLNKLIDSLPNQEG